MGTSLTAAARVLLGQRWSWSCDLLRSGGSGARSRRALVNEAVPAGVGDLLFLPQSLLRRPSMVTSPLASVVWDVPAQLAEGGVDGSSKAVGVDSPEACTGRP